eukprot:2289749-Pleurochrysis_carterae.AAC.1
MLRAVQQAQAARPVRLRTSRAAEEDAARTAGTLLDAVAVVTVGTGTGAGWEVRSKGPVPDHCDTFDACDACGAAACA